jgi:cholesterol oxidase
MGDRALYDEQADLVVVGSGFGGSVVACRAAEHGQHAVVLERGRRYLPGDFPRTPLQLSTATWDPSEGLYGPFQIWSFRRLVALAASGVGGGSLIYANVTMPMPPEWFDLGRGHWPLDYDDIAEHYPAVQKMLGAEPMPTHLDPHVPKVAMFNRAAERADLRAVRAPLAVTFSAPTQPLGAPIPQVEGEPGPHRRTCRLCGECDLGCNDGAKNSLDHNYLARAEARTRPAPAQVRELCDVRRITAVDGGYLVEYLQHEVPDPIWARTRRPAGAGTPYRSIFARRVVVSAGALGSTRLLLANRVGLPNLSPALGTRFSGNGDALGFLAGSPATIAESSGGPVITTYVRDGDHLIEDGGQPAWAAWMATGLQPAVYARGLKLLATRWARRWVGRNDADIGAQIATVLGAAHTARRTLPLLAMGMDVRTRTMRLDRAGRLHVDWSPKDSADYFAGVWATMSDLADEPGARFRRFTSAWLSKNVTAHPLGGVPMGADPWTGVVDSYGQVFGHPGLYVADGSVVPGPVGANPSMTIAALAERFATRMLEGDQ